MPGVFEVSDSQIEGRGGFAIRDIEQGEIICEFEGPVRSFEEFAKLHELGNKRISCDHFQIGVRTYIDLLEPYVYLNHSCDPNSGLKGEKTLVALRHIKKGEEIVYDYSATE